MKKDQTTNAFYIKEIFPNDFFLEEFERTFSEGQNILKDNRNIIKVLRLGEIETVTKSFKTPGLIQGVIYKFFRKSKARRSYEYSLLLNRNGIKTPEPLGYIEVFDRFRLRQSYYISRRLEYDFTFDFATERQVVDYKNILKSFIDFTYKMHKKNLMHLDYCTGNICIKETNEGYDFYVVDVNRLRKGTVTPKTGINNLARISRDPEIIRILADEYKKKISNSFPHAHSYLIRSVKHDQKRVRRKRLIKSIIAEVTNISSSSFVWDYYSNQPHVLRNKKLKRKIFILAWSANLKIIPATLYALFISLFFFIKNKDSFGKKIDSFGLCVNIDEPIESQKSISNIELIEMIDELSVDNILVRLPLADFDNLEKYLGFITQLKDKDVLVCILQDREHIVDERLTKERLDIIFTRLDAVVNKFQIGNSINRKKWAFLSIDEYFSFFKIAHDLKKNKFPKLKLLGGNIIDFDLPFFARSVFHLRSIYYDGVATQLYVDRRGSPEQKQFGFDALAKIKAYAALAEASVKTSNELYITEVNWPLYGMGAWAPAQGDCMIKESLQSCYLVRYYLLMLASGKIKKCYWHQLVAPGYGLVNNLDGHTVKRDAYYCFKHLIAILAGGKTKKLIRKNNLFCFIVEKDNMIIEAVWSSGESICFKSNPRQLIVDMRGNIIETNNSPAINITGDVIYFKKQKDTYREINLKAISQAATLSGRCSI